MAAPSSQGSLAYLDNIDTLRQEVTRAGSQRGDAPLLECPPSILAASRECLLCKHSTLPLPVDWAKPLPYLHMAEWVR